MGCNVFSPLVTWIYDFWLTRQNKMMQTNSRRFRSHVAFCWSMSPDWRTRSLSGLSPPFYHFEWILKNHLVTLSLCRLNMKLQPLLRARLIAFVLNLGKLQVNMLTNWGCQQHNKCNMFIKLNYSSLVWVTGYYCVKGIGFWLMLFCFVFTVWLHLYTFVDAKSL